MKLVVNILDNELCSSKARINFIGKFLEKVRKVSTCTSNRLLCYQLFLRLHDWSLMALSKKMVQPPLPKRKLGPPPNTGGLQEI